MNTKLQNIACMPAITWHKLKMNDSNIELSENIKLSEEQIEALNNLEKESAGTGTSSSSNSYLINEESSFIHAMNKAQEDWYEAHKDDEVAISSSLANDEEAAYGGLSMSDYQKRADEIEQAKDIRVAFQSGFGQKAYSWMRALATDKIACEISENDEREEMLTINAENNAAKISSIDVVAEENSTLIVNICVKPTSESANTTPEAANSTDDNTSSSDDNVDQETQEEASALTALTGTSIRVFAGKNSHVIIRRVQTLPDNFIDLDDMGLFLDENAHVEIKQTLLGAGKTITGLAADLRGKNSQIEIDLHYLGRKSEQRDFNYIISHHGEKTSSQINANGVLAGRSIKTLRGTIDLIKGAKGATGTENENVLLIDDEVRNKTVPIILCNEDDVAGNHGATIGHIRADQMFYLASRGLSQKDAEEMFVCAYLENALIDAPNDDIKNAILVLGNKIIENFGEL